MRTVRRMTSDTPHFLTLDLQMDATEQRRLIVEQFTRQAAPFAEMPMHNGEETNWLVLDTLGIRASDRVLDIACGPGLITCAVAKLAQHVTGLDLTPAMLEQARRQQALAGLDNLTWTRGDVEALPFPAASFSCVMTRYSFHHFTNPKAVLAEMVRVTQPGGRVGVIDVFMRNIEHQAAYDRAEILRDPSHVKALLLEDLTGMFFDAGLTGVRTAFYRLETNLESLLTATGTSSESAAQVRQIFAEDLSRQLLGVGTFERDGAIHFSFPVVIVVGIKPTNF